MEIDSTWIEKYQKKAFIASVAALGHENVANEMRNLLSIPDDDQTVNFFNEDSLPFLNSQIYNDLFLKLRKEDFKTSLFTISDIQKIEQKLGTKVVKYDKCLFEELYNEFALPKNLIFSPDFLQYFRTRNNFNGRRFIDFILKASKMQYALFMIYSKNLDHSDYLTGDQLRDFIDSYINRIPPLKEILTENNGFREYYIEIVANRFIFDLSYSEDARFEIPRLVKSTIFFQFIFYEEYPNGPFDYENVYEIYQKCSELLDGESQFINDKSIKHFSTCILSDAFIQRLFEVIQADSQNFIDFVVFLQIYYPFTFLTTKQGTHFFFRILDLNSDGVITRADILYFYKAIVKESNINIDFDAFMGKLLDIIGCRSESVTEEVLNQSQNQDLFFKLLIDLKTFKKWEGDGHEEEEESPDEIIFSD